MDDSLRRNTGCCVPAHGSTGLHRVLFKACQSLLMLPVLSCTGTPAAPHWGRLGLPFLFFVILVGVECVAEEPDVEGAVPKDALQTRCAAARNATTQNSSLSSARGQSVIGVYHGPHDSSVAVAIHGQVVLTLPLYIVFGVPCFGWVHLPQRRSPHRAALGVWTRTAASVAAALQALGHRNVTYDAAVFNSDKDRGIAALLGPHAASATVQHHRGHALYGFYDSAFSSALVVTMDGGGDGDVWNVYLGSREGGARGGGAGVRLLKRLGTNLGSWFQAAAKTVPEVVRACGLGDQVNRLECIGAALMDYAALGPAPGAAVQELLRTVQLPERARWPALQQTAQRWGLAGNATAQRVFAAAAQAALQRAVVGGLDPVWQAHPDVQGLVVVGGVGANAVLVSHLHRRYRRPVHVPALPGDAGLSLGFLLGVLRPPAPLEVAFTGPPLAEASALPRLVATHGGTTADPREVAARLVSGAVMAVVRGRQPITLRSLGTRTVLALPNSTALAERTRRTPFSPAQSMVALDGLGQLCEGPVPALYGWAAPVFHRNWTQQLPFLVDGGGRGRVLTIARSCQPWLHAVLVAVGQRVGVPVLTHGSFLQGSKHISGIQQAMEAFHEDPLVNAIVLEGFLFEKSQPAADISRGRGSTTGP